MGESKYDELGEVILEVSNFPSEGLILDIGGGGEGVIGQLKGRDVVAVDWSKEELEEAADGPLKIVMDARDLKFLENSFNTATAFFSLMYFKSQDDHKKVLSEVARVLRPGGAFHVWDIDLPERPETGKEIYVIRLRYRIGEQETETGYGQKWPEEIRDEKYYITLAEEAGFRHIQTERNKNTFYLLLQKR